MVLPFFFCQLNERLRNVKCFGWLAIGGISNIDVDVTSLSLHDFNNLTQTQKDCSHACWYGPKSITLPVTLKKNKKKNAMSQKSGAAAARTCLNSGTVRDCQTPSKESKEKNQSSLASALRPELSTISNQRSVV